MRKVLFLGLVCITFRLVWAQSLPVQDHAQPAAQSAPVIKFDEVAHNFGNVIEGEIARYEFTFINTGTDSLKLTSVQASCGCTTPRWPREAIAPGQSAVISAEFNSTGRPGSFNKNIFVKSNGGDVTLTISGIVISEPTKPKSPIIIKG